MRVDDQAFLIESNRKIREVRVEIQSVPAEIRVDLLCKGCNTWIGGTI